jgi:hypothetical protein
MRYLLFDSFDSLLEVSNHAQALHSTKLIAESENYYYSHTLTLAISQ